MEGLLWKFSVLGKKMAAAHMQTKQVEDRLLLETHQVQISGSAHGRLVPRYWIGDVLDSKSWVMADGVAHLVSQQEFWLSSIFSLAFDMCPG